MGVGQKLTKRLLVFGGLIIEDKISTTPAGTQNQPPELFKTFWLICGVWIGDGGSTKLAPRNAAQVFFRTQGKGECGADPQEFIKMHVKLPQDAHFYIFFSFSVVLIIFFPYEG